MRIKNIQLKSIEARRFTKLNERPQKIRIDHNSNITNMQDEKKGEIRDKIFKAGRANPLNFGRDEDLLLFLQRIRDEAHRFAISFHRRRRKKRSLQSALDTIPGVGKKRKATLLRHFKSVKNIRAAGIEEIRALPGFNRKAAESVNKALAT